MVTLPCTCAHFSSLLHWCAGINSERWVVRRFDRNAIFCRNRVATSAAFTIKLADPHSANGGVMHDASTMWGITYFFGAADFRRDDVSAAGTSVFLATPLDISDRNSDFGNPSPTGPAKEAPPSWGRRCWDHRGIERPQFPSAAAKDQPICNVGLSSKDFQARRDVFLPHLAVHPAGVDEADLGAAAVRTGPNTHVWHGNCVFRVLDRHMLLKYNAWTNKRAASPLAGFSHWQLLRAKTYQRRP
jgi:hypothetical protein